MKKKVTPEISEYMSQLSLKRKNKRGGFNLPEVQARIKLIKDEKKSTKKINQATKEEI